MSPGSGDFRSDVFRITRSDVFRITSGWSCVPAWTAWCREIRARGATEIASELPASANTVNTHIRNIFSTVITRSWRCGLTYLGRTIAVWSHAVMFWDL